MTYAYLRQLADNQSLSRQQQHILSYTLAHGLEIDQEVMEYSNPSHRIEARKKFETFIHGLTAGDRIITQNLWVLSCHMEEIIKIINCMLSHQVDLHITESGIRINRETSITTLFPLLNTLNEERKEKRNQVGRPRGSRSSSKFDPLQAEIIAGLRQGMSVSALARELGVSRSSLKDYIESRELRQLIKKPQEEVSRDERSRKQQQTLLICPFEEGQSRERTHQNKEGRS